MWVVAGQRGRYTLYEQNVRPVRGGGPDVGDRVFVCWDQSHAVTIGGTEGE